MKKGLCIFLLFSFSLVFGQNQSNGNQYTANYQAGQLLVQLDPSVDAIDVFRSLEERHDLAIKEIQLLTEIVNIYQVVFEDPTLDLNQAIGVLQAYPMIWEVQKNHFIEQRETIPTDTLFNNQWHLQNDGSSGGTVDADIDATEAWDITTGGTTTHGDEIVVCVIEGSGVDISHVDLVDNIWHNTAEIAGDGIDNDGNGYIDDYDGWNVETENDAVGSGSHGTRVSSMIGAKGNNVTGISGVNWDVKIMVVKGQSASDEASVIAAYAYPLKMRKMYNESYGEEGAFVVATNSSWGIDGGDPDSSPIWCSMYDSMGVQGILSVAATTNSDDNVDEVGDLPTTCSSEYLIAVTMTNDTDNRAASGYGPINVDLGAPGFGVQLAFPGNVYGNTSGTSFATPCVAGAIALAYSTPCPSFINWVKYDPAQAALDMRDYIYNNVDPIPSLSGEVATGGRLNIHEAILEIVDGCDENPCIPPYDLHYSSLTDSAVVINWNGFSTDYTVYISADGGLLVPFPTTTLTSLTIDTLSPCTTYTIMIKSQCSGGETSDFSYPITFTTDGCCNNPDLSAIDVDEENMSISWPPILYATQYDLRYREVGTTDWMELTDVSSPVAISELEACTKYEYQIYTLCTDSTQGYSDSYEFRTKGCGACTEADYCAISGASFNLEWIEGIQLNDFSNTSGPNSGWLVSEKIITALTPEQSYIFTIIPGYSGFNFTENFSAWIDFNHDGIWNPDEQIIDNLSSNAPLNANIFIPSDATIGVTKLRIGMSALSEPESCQTDNFWGEFEDYCVYIGPQLGLEELGQEDWTVYPNPVDQLLYVQSSSPILSVQLISMDGKQMFLSSQFNGQIDVSDLSNGVYFVRIETEKGSSTKKVIKQ